MIIIVQHDDCFPSEIPIFSMGNDLVSWSKRPFQPWAPLDSPQLALGNAFTSAVWELVQASARLGGDLFGDGLLSQWEIHI